MVAPRPAAVIRILGDVADAVRPGDEWAAKAVLGSSGDHSSRSSSPLVVGVLLLNSHRQKTPVTHRVQHVTLTDAQQMQLGSQEYAKTLRANRARIVSSGPEYAEVQRVARRIEAVAGRDKPDFVWRVTLIRKNEANAYCLPGGKIVVYTGILPLTENDAGLATVLGHEVAHATAEHVAERIERNHLTEVAAAIIAGGVAFTPAQFVRVTALLGVGAGLPVQPLAGVRGGSHRAGLHGESGLRPTSGGRVLEAHAARIEGKEPPEFLSDHPSDAHRVQRVRGWLPEAEREYSARN